MKPKTRFRSKPYEWLAMLGEESLKASRTPEMS